MRNITMKKGILMTAIISFFLTILLCAWFYFDSSQQSNETGDYAFIISVFIFIPLWAIVSFFVYFFLGFIDTYKKDIQKNQRSIIYIYLLIGFPNQLIGALTQPYFRYKTSKYLFNNSINILDFHFLIPYFKIIFNWLGLIGIALLTLTMLGKRQASYSFLTLSFILCGIISWGPLSYRTFGFSNIVTLMVTFHLIYLGGSYLLPTFNKAKQKDAQ